MRIVITIDPTGQISLSTTTAPRSRVTDNRSCFCFSQLWKNAEQAYHFRSSYLNTGNSSVYIYAPICPDVQPIKTSEPVRHVNHPFIMPNRCCFRKHPSIAIRNSGCARLHPLHSFFSVNRFSLAHIRCGSRCLVPVILLPMKNAPVFRNQNAVPVSKKKK